MYGAVLFIHILAAIMGLGVAFGFPAIAKSAKTTTEAKFVLGLLKKMETIPKVGSIILLLTGLILGFLNPVLFKTGWYIISIVIYLAVQVIVAKMIPDHMKAQLAILENHSEENLPEEYLAIGKKSAGLERISHVAAIVLVVLMYFRPF